jgi:hypothetical protein
MGVSSADADADADRATGGGSKSWMSLCLAATKLMDEKAQSGDDATTDPDDEEDNAVNKLLCFETIGGTDPSILSDPSVMHAIKEAKRRKKDPCSTGMIPTKRHKGQKPARYIRGVPAIRYVTLFVH